MKRSQAPLYVKVMALIHDVLPRCEKLPRHQRQWAAPRIQHELFTLLDAISLALTFKEGRSLRLQQADEALVRLRMTFEILAQQNHLSPRQVRHVMDQLDLVGRMLGGWRKAETRRAPVLSPV